MTPASWPRAKPLEERLLWVQPDTGALADLRVRDLPSLLGEGDVVVVNDAATLPASFAVTHRGNALEVRLAGRKADGNFRAVLFGAGDWHQLTTERPVPPPIAIGDAVRFGERVIARVTAVSPVSARLVELALELPEDALYAALFALGRPVQYWYQDGTLDPWHVQTAFAGRPWAVEMPSAGRPLTVPLLVSLRRRGVRVVTLTHAAGLSATGDEALDRALPLPELSELPADTARAVNAAHARGRRVIAVGTSVVRALEGAAAAHGGALVADRTEIDLRVGPGFVPRVVHALLTGMHDTGESHFDLLSAFAPGDLLARATAHAQGAGYLCHEFGDSTFISSSRATTSPP